ncbi:tyrosine-type recombinase/integrase [Amycolatopsis palatopharyngis]|uniref:tyrosine-type recombinase/integrase n=1 Tax=Amycolatopsis palatopharyngis TaxID=187982 RepID=UPI001FE3D024|nr:site-specific integrase [Amycolatopsis palatopharyngis]
MARRVDLEGAAHLVLTDAVVPLHPAETVFDAMLVGWRRQQRSRLLSPGTVENRESIVRRFAAFTNAFPWQWSPSDVEDWTSELLSGPRPLVHSTIRNYQVQLALFCDYLVDARYGWVEECEQRFGTHPVQICHEFNVARHTALYEGRPEVRALSRQELQNFFDFADDRVVHARKQGRKGWLTAFRDATIFKVAYGWGLRRRETAMLDVVDFGRNPNAPEFGGYGACYVRYGKALKGSPPRRRTVWTVWPWTADAVAEYVEEVRPQFGVGKRLLLWPTERGARIAPRDITRRFAAYRDELGLDEALHPHCLRHSHITHCIEDGADPFFVQSQAGHSWGSTTSLYTNVGSDFMNKALHDVLAPKLDATTGGSTG